MERRSAHNHAADVDRSEMSERVQRAGPADIHRDVFDGRHLLDRRKFVGRGPTRFASHKTDLFLLAHVVDFDHDAVDFEFQGVAVLVKFDAARPDRVDLFDDRIAVRR